MDRVNGMMYSKFDVGYRLIKEKATVKPQFKSTTFEDEYTVMHPTECVYFACNNQCGHSYSKVYSNNSGLTNVFPTSGFTSCKRHINALIK